MCEFRVLFEDNQNKDFANAVVVREEEDTDTRHAWKTRMFQMACSLGLLEDTVIITRL